MLNSIRDLHDGLSNVFEQLATSRLATSRPLYFCEHGLTDREISDLSQRERCALRNATLNDVLSSDTHLAFIVCATEVGYQYLGNGTDFWPQLEKAVGYHFDFVDRASLSDWFRNTAERFGGVIPGRSDWSCPFAISLGRSHMPSRPRTFGVHWQFAQALPRFGDRRRSYHQPEPGVVRNRQ